MLTPNFESERMHLHAPRQHGQERTADDPQHGKENKPEELTGEEQRQLIELVRKYKQSWFLRRADDRETGAQGL